MTYIIGEIGQNHNGSPAMAKALIELVAEPIQEPVFGYTLKPIDAIKLTKRDLSEELTGSQMKRPYEGRNSFGPTYGEHRAALELSDEEHREVFLHAKGLGLDCVETICSIGAMSVLKAFTPDRLKVASRDLTNIPLLEALAETKIPMIISTGMAGERELEAAVQVITRYHSDLSILHCVSQYPTDPHRVNFQTIPYLKEKYPQFKIGYSDHTIGIMAPIVAAAKGAEIIEKHITLHRGLRGTDQAGSLAPDGITRMVRDIRLLEQGEGIYGIFADPVVNGAREKLERSIAAKVGIPKGQVIREGDIHLLSPGTGLNWLEKGKVIGRKATKDLPKDELINEEDME